MEGTIEVLPGVHLGSVSRFLLGALGVPIIRGMTAVARAQIGKSGLELSGCVLAVMTTTGVVSVATSMAFGFLIGMLLFHAWTRLQQRQ